MSFLTLHWHAIASEIINDDQVGNALVPIVALAETRNPDSSLSPMTPEALAEAVGTLGASVLIDCVYTIGAIGI
jgi:hypothetical protein